jgi:hypothetical protein
MMAINNYSGRANSIRTETNVQGTFVDNDEYVASRAHNEHNPQPSDNPWSTTYKPNREVIWQEEPQPPLVLDDALKTALKNDLKIRGIHNSNPNPI